MSKPKTTTEAVVFFGVATLGFGWLALTLLWIATSPFFWFFRLTGMLP